MFSSAKNLFLKSIYLILASYARRIIRRHKPFVIGITGSVGKSTTKEMVYQVMSDHFKENVRKNYGNLNAEFGIPLTILGYDRMPNKLAWPLFLVKAYFKSYTKIYPKYLILEMGVEHKGDLQYFGTIVRPDIGIIISTAPAHTANFKSHSEQQEEKLEMAKIIKPDGILIVNADDVNVSKIDFEKILTVGITSQSVNYQGNSVKVNENGTEYRIATLGQKISIKSALIGEHFIYAALFSFAVGQQFGIQSLEIKKSIEKVVSEPGRMNLIKGRDGITILDDTYNASPASMKAALLVLSKFNGRRVAILGNMNELGDLEKEAHQKIAEFARERSDFAIFVGRNSEEMAKIYGQDSVRFNSRRELDSHILEIIKPNDTVLIKASQNGNFLEETVKLLLKDRSESSLVLVRQSKFWLKKKGIK